MHCDAAVIQIGTLLPRIGSLLPKKQKTFAGFVYTEVSKTQCSFTSLQIFRSCICSGDVAQ